ncbi:MAG: PLDc_N domain-containing protein [Chloroflexi bacterium]|nr:PLDc_N domain-containing protein [Chloroflexota bacterium]
MLIVLGVAVQYFLMGYAVCDLVHRPTAQLKGARKWPWALLVVLVSTLGPIIYLLASQKKQPAQSRG